MNVKKTESLQYRLAKRISEIQDSVIFYSDIEDLSNDAPQLNRALRAIMREKILVRVSRGIYAKAEPVEYFDAPILKDTLENVAQKIFNRLDVKWDLTSAQKEYNSGKSTQVPVRVVFRLNSRLRRKIGYDGYYVRYERNIYAR